MAIVSINDMRIDLAAYFTKRGWNPNKIKWMPDAQVKAIYYKYSNEGWPLPKSKPKSGAVQLSLFDK